MTRAARRSFSSHRPASACEVIEIRRVTSRPPPASDTVAIAEEVSEEEPDTQRITVPDPVPALTGIDGDDATRVEQFRQGPPSGTILTTELLSDLKRRLRAAEAREEATHGAATHEAAEGSGIRLRPTPDDGMFRPWLEDDSVDDLEMDLEVDLEPPLTHDQWSGMIDTLTELEVALAPNSESNFFGGFDHENPDGIFVATYRDLPIDTPVYVDVHLPAGFRFRTPALVEFVRGQEAATSEAPAGIGLRMCGLDDGTRRLIREFVRHRAPLFYVG